MSGNREITFRAEHDGKEYEVSTDVEMRAGSKGRYKQHGYVKRKVTEHPFSDKRGYVMEHRLIMEEHLGFFLPKDGVVHHKNGERDDNRLENLQILDSQTEHAIIEQQKMNRKDNGRFEAHDDKLDELKFRLLNKNTQKINVYTLTKLINTTFRRGQFEYRGRFTGLKDTNGQEIYEGDVVQDDNEKPAYLEYEPENAGFKLWSCEDGCHAWGIESRLEDCEVIGNIYENPELLEEDE